MKRFLTLSIFILCVGAVFAQQVIVLRRPAYPVTYGSTCVQTYTTTNVVRNVNIEDKVSQTIPIEIYDEYKKAKDCKIAGGIFVTVGVFALVGGAVAYYAGTCSEERRMGNHRVPNNQPLHKNIGIGLMASGGALLTVGIPLAAWGNHAKRDYDLYYGKRIKR